MEAIMLGIIIILMGVSVFFAYRYFSLKHHLHIHKEIINGMEELSAGNIANKVDERSSKHTAFNGLIDYFGLVREKFFSYSKDVHEKGENLTEVGEYASEKADIVRAAIDEVGRGLTKQLAATEESAASMEEMTQAIEDLSVRSLQISEQSNTTLELTQDGNEKLKDSLDKMNQFNQTVNITFDAINKLGEKSHEIGTIVKVITGISEQINLLALNAAIEAARAGEHGKGFAVVADEVRKLAEQSRQSSSEVSNIVKNIQEETEVVVNSMQQGTEELKDTNTTLVEVGAMFKQILATTKIIAENNENSSASTQELSSASQQIMATIVEIASISRESVEMFEELLEISDDELSAMQKLVQVAKNLVELTNDVNKLIFAWNHGAETEAAQDQIADKKVSAAV
ncbi:methyl-accepting chemotaxis protein [Cytobacillus firmus]|uniref:Methyl-accepting chemotaxis protein n=2 Tax=Cytobacillus TaxID=2675230 RepID=A0A366JMI0_CYTFI|nr:MULTISPECIES: methyl-accepting chemotaxis protein [Cytobacillus]RBP87366.1 methyl-accepting chemotaxis protein [Cytobacillus firmus]TDX37066.1 methyl-accepting chemotaxis protein [Cytobacillus oceanisediminis]